MEDSEWYLAIKTDFPGKDNTTLGEWMENNDLERKERAPPTAPQTPDLQAAMLDLDEQIMKLQEARSKLEAQMARPNM